MRFFMLLSSFMLVIAINPKVITVEGMNALLVAFGLAFLWDVIDTIKTK
jgi:hypothetical protein